LVSRQREALMWEWLRSFWNDSVWSKVIAGLILTGLGWTARRSLFSNLRKPMLRQTHAYPSDQISTGATYPLKYYVEVINDSSKCVAVRVVDFRGNAVTLQKFLPGIPAYLGLTPRRHQSGSI